MREVEVIIALCRNSFSDKDPERDKLIMYLLALLTVGGALPGNLPIAHTLCL